MDQSWIKAEQVGLNDGINSGFRADQIGVNQAAWGSNIAVRNAKPKTRGYGLVQRAMMPKGLVQGTGYFSPSPGIFITSIWGQLWRILITGNNVQVELIPLGFRNSSLRQQAWMCETDGSFLVQDGESACIIFDGSIARRSNPTAFEVPTGKQMAYGNGRLAVAVDDNQLQVGNITTDIFQSELVFTETTYLSGGGAFFFTHPITGLAFLPVNNTDTGFGSLIVFGTRYVNSLQLNITARELWDQIPSFEQVLLPRIGATAQNVIVPVNQDLYWRDSQGNIWSLRSAQWDALSPGNSPVSFEMSRVVDFETESQLQYSSGVFFDNRLLFLASPIYNIFGGASFTDIISLDAAALATMRGKSPPAYDGVAEGLNFVSLFAGQINGMDRAFVISTDDDGENRLWELVPQLNVDQSNLSSGSTYSPISNLFISNGSSIATVNPITSYFESRRFDFGQPGRKKQIMRCDLFPTDIDGEVTMTVYWRADNRTQWNLWGSVSVCAEMTNADGQWLTLANQERGRIKTLSAPTGVDVIDGQALDVGYGFQVRIVWQGSLVMDRVQIWARPLDETAYSEQNQFNATCQENVVTNNDISYSIPIGGLGSAYTDQVGKVYVDEFGIPYTPQPL